jgi:spore germination protein GerM
VRHPRTELLLVGVLVSTGVLVAFAVVAIRWIDGDQDVTTIPVEDVPYSLLEDEVPVSTTDADPEDQKTIYLVYEGALVPVRRPADGTMLTALVRDLAHGPTPEEVAVGLSSVVPPEAVPVRVRVARNRAIVELARPLHAGRLDDRNLTLAQIVYTLTAEPGIDAVRFQLDGELVEVPTDEATLTRAAVTRADFPVQILAVAP